MLHLLFGRAGSGKSTEVLRQIRQKLIEGKSVLLIVPEQFTFETERRYYQVLGGKMLAKLQIASFSRLAEKLALEYGKTPGDEASAAVETLLMSLALDEVRDDLLVYQKPAAHLSFASDVLQLMREMKTASCTPKVWEEALQKLPNGNLKEKLSDAVKIITVYQAMLGERYHDAQDALQKFAGLLKEHPIFEGKTVFLDGFHGYTGQELELLRDIMRQCEDCTITLCLDPKADPNGLFAPSFETRRRLEELARQEHSRLAVPQVLEPGRRFSHPQLSFLETHLLQDHRNRYTGEMGGVYTALADHELDEVRFAAATVRKLAEEGIAYREMLVVSRDLPTYQSALEEVFAQYGIPYYLDTKKSAAEHPLLRLLHLSLMTAAGTITSESIVSLLKCGLSPFSVDEVAELENYCYCWDIRREDWEREFLFSPFGMEGARSKEQQEQEGEILTRLNAIRTFAYPAVDHLRQALRTQHAAKCCEGLLTFLEEFGVRDAINRELSSIDVTKGEDVQSASTYRQLWKLLQESVQTLHYVLGKRPVEPARFAELFSLLMGQAEIGAVPQSLDCVQIGSVERVRAAAPKVLFVLGVNDQVFPYLPKNDSIFTDEDREELLETAGVRMAKTARDQMLEERFLAYQTMATPSERLYLIARRADIRGSAKAVSRIFPLAQRLFGEEIFVDVSLLSPLYFCRTRISAFQEMAAHFRDDTPEEATLKDYFASDGEYRVLMDHLLHLHDQKARRLENPALIRKLYGERVTVSPSRIETYHKCQFRYFCEYGLGLKPRQKVKLNASVRGSLVHEILNAVCRRMDDYTTFDEEKVRLLVEETIEAFLHTMGGAEHQTHRVRYLCRQAEEDVIRLLRRLFEELGCSSFRPVAFEYQIGKPGNLPPYLFESTDGITIAVRGVIDRVDTYTDTNGKCFVRIIDYKTGTKEFALSDLLNGINLQMFLYLMCFDQHTVEEKRPLLAAGALYMPAGTATEPLGRGEGEADAQLVLMNHYRMKGVVLDDAEIIRAMEPEMNGQYTPIKIKASGLDANGDPKEDLFEGDHANPKYFYESSCESLLQEGQLHQVFHHLERMLEQMVHELYHGSMEAKPLSGKVNGCDYCEFSSVCGYREGDPVRDYRTMKKADFFKTLQEEDAHG